MTKQLFLLSSVKTSGRFFQIFVAFSEKLNFIYLCNYAIHSYAICERNNWKNKNLTKSRDFFLTFPPYFKPGVLINSTKLIILLYTMDRKKCHSKRPRWNVLERPLRSCKRSFPATSLTVYNVARNFHHIHHN